MTKKKSQRIAFVGTANSWVEAPFGDKSWEIWCVGGLQEAVSRADRWFEVHRIASRDPEWAKNWRELLRKAKCPIWMFYPEPDLGKVIQYPVKEVAEKYGTFFMTSTFSWMCALSLYEGAGPGDEWGFFGVDMEYGTEYKEQRAGLQHFKDMARVLGVAITHVTSSGLAYEPIPYPLWQDDPLLAKIELRQKTLVGERDSRDAAVSGARARLGQIRAILKEGNPDSEKRHKLERELVGLEKSIPGLEQNAAWCKGCLDELDWLENYLKP